MVKAEEPVPEIFAALTVAWKVPTWVAEPEIKPVEESRLRPEGKPEAPKLVGVLSAAI